MFNVILNIIKEHKKPIIVFSCIFLLALIGKNIYNKKIIPYLSKYKLEQSFKEAAKIPSEYWDEKYNDMELNNKYKVVIVSHGGGEYNYSEFFKFAAERMGWEVQIYYRQTLGYEKKIINFDPDFILFTSHTNLDLEPQLILHRSKKYLLSLDPIQKLVNKNLYNKGIIELPYDFEKMVKETSGLFTSAKEIDIYNTEFNKKYKNLNTIRILPLTPEMINDPAEPNSLAWTGGGEWDTLRSSDRFKNFIISLSKNVPMKIYGPYKHTYLKPNTYDGYIPSALEMIKAIRKNGIYLLTHSDIHIKSETPTLRIFEAVAANVVIISDKHQFSIDNFGDNFLYFDQNADAETMYRQVKSHVDWIKNNPAKAKAMADRAHKIFLEKFTLEKDLVRMAKMHEYIIQQEKKMKTTYPVIY